MIAAVLDTNVLASGFVGFLKRSSTPGQLLDQMAGLARSLTCALGLRQGGEKPAPAGVVLVALRKRMAVPEWVDRQEERRREMRVAVMVG